MYTLHHQSPFIVLLSSEKDPLLFNVETGKSEVLKFIASTYTVEIGKVGYIYAYNDQQAFLANDKNMDERKILPKKYVDIRESGDYLIGYINEEPNSLVDILSKSDLKIKIKNLRSKRIQNFKTDDDKSVYVVNEPNQTLFFDVNFKNIGSASKEFTEFEDIAKFLILKYKITLIEPKQEVTELTTGPGPQYPYIKLTGNLNSMTCMVHESREIRKPLFSFARKNYRIGNDSYSNKITLSEREENREKTYSLFYVNVKEKKILLPKKYWADIDLKMSDQVDF
ncbi:hypothetical protein FNJ88_00750 [Chryseobacterium sp. SNU WT5]|uniref:hypothetical protein n=1 Tax=Chryseobacterium sp. SNU WT5 TaxID=2594269 RepID=UPI001181370F|nr:hypothetical protein [Chryseobacterium sp. SNU WT5]QDP84154.1 hypothetical protein FNJ88_00750 [Chryseobacterium sp. SNU WT5]